MSYISQYLFKLYSTSSSSSPKIDGIVFSGGIGEKSEDLRKDVLQRLGWLGAVVDDEANAKSEGAVREITSQESKLTGYVVETDEEGWSARLAREQLGF
jgi:acetate kinase